MTRHSRSSSRRERPVAAWAGLAFAIGCGTPALAGTWTLDARVSDAMLAFAAAAGVAAVGLLAGGWRSVGRAFTLAAVVALGAGLAVRAGCWSLSLVREGTVGIGSATIPAEDGDGRRCDAVVPVEGMPVMLHGRVATTPRPPPEGSDWLGRELQKRDGLRFALAEAAVAAEGTASIRRIRGAVRVVCGPGGEALRTGDVVELRGWLFPARKSTNPNPAPRASDVWPTGGRIDTAVATLTVGEGGFRLVEPGPEGWNKTAESLRAGLRSRVERVVEAVAPDPATGPSDPRPGLALTMLFGRGSHDDPETRDHFARSGLSHLVAISGFNFAVLGLGASVLLRACGGPWRLGAVVTAALSLAYLAVVDDEPSVARAGFVAIVGAMAEAFGRRFQAASLLGAAAILLLVADPLAIVDPGFQLTFAAVLALRWAATPLGERWYGREDVAPSTAVEATVAALRGLLVSCLAVWLAVTPIAMAHFGQIAWIGLPLSIVAIPLGGLAIGNGLGVAVAAAIDERLAVPIAYPWVWLTGALLWIAELPARCNVPDLDVGRTGWVWSTIAVGLAVAWCRSVLWPVRRLAACGLVVAWIPIGWIAVTKGNEKELEWTMLDVGDGSCHILRQGATAVVFDAGSLDHPSLGIRSAIPALRAAGVRRLEAVIVSHPNLDHFTAVPSILARFPTRRLIVNPATQQAAETDGGSACGLLLAAARANRVPIEIGAVGRRDDMLGARWTWLHPHVDDRYAGANDGSMAIHVHSPIGDAGLDLMLAGDLETKGVRDLLERTPPSAIDIAELPHHGSWRPAVAAWIEALSPQAVFQSTGPERFRRDRWREVLAGVSRRVTCVDGAVRASVRRGGRGEAFLHLDRWTPSGWSSCGRIAVKKDSEVQPASSRFDHDPAEPACMRRSACNLMPVEPCTFVVSAADGGTVQRQPRRDDQSVDSAINDEAARLAAAGSRQRWARGPPR